MLFSIALLLLVVSVAAFVTLAARKAYHQAKARQDFILSYNCKRSGPSYPGYVFLFGYDFLMTNVVDVIKYRFAEGNAYRHDLFGPTYWSRILIKEVINTVEPENLEAVFKTHFEDYRLIDARQKLMETFYGNGIIGNSGHCWKRSRSIVHPAITSMTQALDASVFEEHMRNLINRIRAQDSVNFAELAAGYSLDISSKYFFGDSTYSLEPRDVAQHQFAKDFTLVGKMSRTLTIFNRQFPFLRKAMFWHGYHNSTRSIQKFVDDHIDNASKHDKNNTVIGNLIGLSHDKTEIRGEVLNMLLAARDTVGIVLSELIYLLARHPRVWAKLREEVSVIRGPPTFTEVPKLAYLKQVMSEGSRLRSTFSVHGRIAVRDTVLPRGGGDGSEPLFVPEGAYVVYCIYKLHRNPAVFGEDVEEFRPERWDSVSPSTFEYLPFSAGPRQCPGKQMATVMIGYALVRLAQEFETIMPMDTRPWQEARAFSFFNRNGVHVAMK